jgi:hypothetical protein
MSLISSLESDPSPAGGDYRDMVINPDSRFASGISGAPGTAISTLGIPSSSLNSTYHYPTVPLKKDL